MVKFEFLGKLKDNGEEEEGNSIEDIIKQLSDDGYSQNEITEELRDMGYAYSEINQAMNTVIRDSAGGKQGERSARTAQQGDFDQGGMEGGQDFEEPAGRSRQPEQQGYREEDAGYSGYEEQGGYQEESYSREPDRRQNVETGEDFEEEYEDDEWAPDIGLSSDEEALIETIIEEKLIDIEDEFDELYKELDSLIERIEKVEMKVHDLETRRDEDEKEFVQKVNNIEEYMEESHSRIGGLEKAFQQTLPSLVENVRDLTDLVQDMKKRK